MSRYGKCQECKAVGSINVHHKDENRRNNLPENLITLCVSCHRRRHLDKLQQDRGAYKSELKGMPLSTNVKKDQYNSFFPRITLHNYLITPVMPNLVGVENGTNE